MTQLTKREQASTMVSLSERWGIESEQLIPVCKATIFKAEAAHVSDPELIAFLMICSRYDLNPFLRQIYAFYDTRRKAVVPIVGVDGWVDLINRQKRYEGVQFEEWSDETTGKLLAYTCRLYVEGMRIPVEVTERLTECYRPTDPWNKMPHRMLRHKSLIQAARYAFGFSGIYDEDEGKDIVAGHIEPFTEPKSLREAQEARQEQSDPSPAPPPSGEAEASTEAPKTEGCPGCQVYGMAHLEECPNRPKPIPAAQEADPAPADTEAPATPLLLQEVGKMLAKHNIVFSTADLSAMECRLLLTKRKKEEVEKVIKAIERAREGML